MFCKQCGKEIKDGSKFCKYCGSEVNNAVTSNKTTSNVSSTNNDSKIIIGALVAVIIVLAVVLGVFGLGLFGNDASDSVADDNQADIEANDPVSLGSFPVSRAPELAEVVKDSNGVFPVRFESLSLSKAQCLYILTKSIYEIGSGHPDATFSVGTPDYASNPSGRDNSQTILSANYVDMSKRFSNWIESRGFVPNYIGVYSSGVADVSPSRMLDIAVNVLLQYEDTGSLPSSINI